MWVGDSPGALIKLSISWPSDIALQAMKLKEHLENQVLCTVERTYEQISVENLAMRMNTSLSDLIPRKYTHRIVFTRDVLIV